MSIDWRKAPEGATHRVPTGCWYKIENDLVWLWSSRGEWAGPYPKKQYEDGSMDCMVRRPKLAEEWNGEGLPPVGTVCEWHPNVHGWVEVTILGHERDDTWYRVKGEDHTQTCRNMAFFRPIRTPEQIAEEERQRAIENLGEWLSENCSIPTPYLWEAAQKIYDAGYRKQ